MFEPKLITILGFGEAGSSIASGIYVPGSNSCKVQVIDTALDKNPRGKQMAARANALGLPASAEYTGALSGSDLVISVVTGEDAVAAATMAKPWLRPGTVYADYNSITGPQTRAVSEVFADTGVDFVDVAVMGSFKANGHAAPLLISGSRALQVSHWATQKGTPAKVLNDTIGDASAVKILRSIMMKGLEALSVECLVAAHRQGLVDQVLDNVSDVDNMGFANWVKTLTVTHLVHAKRRMEEVEKAMENLQETGMEPLMSDATRRSHLRTVQAGFESAEVDDLDLQAALELLDSRVYSSLK